MTPVPRFSIITVALEDVKGLERTFQSVQHQTFQDFEWIVVDGGSQDGSCDFLDHLSMPCLKWVSENDKGIYDAMNKGVALSGGEFVVFMNAGDIFSGAHTLAEVDHLLIQKSNEIDIVFGGATLVLPNGNRIYRQPHAWEDYIWHGLPANHQATYYRLNRVRSIGYDIRFKICGDYYLTAGFFNGKARAGYLDATLADFQVGDTSYRNPVPLFLEPYVIQRDFLHLPWYTRARSLAKRFVSTLGLVLLSQPWSIRRSLR